MSNRQRCQRSSPQSAKISTLVYTGENPDNGRPIIRAHLNPLVKWIWMGVVTLLFGTILAMIPSMATNKIRVPVAARVLADDRQTVGAGD